MRNAELKTKGLRGDGGRSPTRSAFGIDPPAFLFDVHGLLTTDAPTDDRRTEPPARHAQAPPDRHGHAPPREDPDAALLPRLRAGDGEAFRLLVDRYGDDLFRLGCSTMGGEADAYDLVQETLVGAFRSVASFDGRSTLRTWLLRILFNQASKAKRSRRLRQTVPLYAAEGPAGEASGGAEAPAGGDANPHGGSPEPAVDARLDVMAMLQTLSEEHRQVLVLREIERLSYAEIAAVLNVPVGTVESRLYRARQDLQRRFPNYTP
jgi:RNA polymerase sigma-70 factor (ECF subfamily)